MGGYGSGWVSDDDWGTFDTWAVNGVAANVACCGCGGGSTVTGKVACQGHSYDKATCDAVGVIAGAIGAAVMGKSTTTMPGTTGGGVTTQGVGTTAATTTTENSGDSSSSLLWLWILLGILALCCLLAL